jgi:hypothetical protein
MYLIIVPALLFSLLVQPLVFAQPSSPEPFNGNLGSWTWGKHKEPPSDEVEENDEDDEGRGETSWERLHTERSDEIEPPESEKTPKSLTPLDVWRMLWSKFKKDE